jgi:hypothetical protein
MTVLDRRSRVALWATVLTLLGIVLVFFAVRLAVDVPHLVAGTVPGPTAFERRYVLHPVPAYLHIVPGVVFLVGALFQLARRFRARHLVLHRRLGRVLVVAGLVSGVLAVVVGVWFPYGGGVEAAATVVFGAWFTTALTLAYLAVRRRDVVGHRRWMIRAFAVALGVGTIRIWIGVFQLLGLLAIQDATGTVWFGVAFWVAFLLHVLVAEAYLRARPTPAGRPAATQEPAPRSAR